MILSDTKKKLLLRISDDLTDLVCDKQFRVARKQMSSGRPPEIPNKVGVHMSDLNKILTDKLTSAISASAEKLASELKPMQDGAFDLGPLLREAVNSALDEKSAFINKNHR